MRQVLSISLPKQQQNDVKTIARKRGFVSVSGYIKHLIDLDKDLISEDDLVRSLREGEKEYAAGETVTADSLADLL